MKLNRLREIQVLLDHSLFFRAVDAVLGFIQRLFAGSILVLALKTPAREPDESSVFIRAVNKFFHLLAWARDHFFQAAYENSGWAYAMKSLGAVAQGSFFVRWLCRLLRIELCSSDEPKWTGVVVFLFLAITAAVGLFFFPPLYVALGAVGLFAALACLALPEIAALAVIAAAPFLPTMLLAAMLGFLILCFCVKLLTDACYQPAADATGLFIIVYALLGVFCGFTSLTPRDSLPIALLSTLFMISYFLPISLLRTKHLADAALFFFCTTAAVTGVYGLVQKVTGYMETAWVDAQLFDDLRMRIYSTFANPNVYGEYLLLAIPVCLVMVRVSRRWIAKLYYLGISLLLLYNLGFTYSRGCYLALAFAAFVCTLFMAKRLVALFFAGLLAVPFFLPAAMLNRVASIVNMGAGDSSTQYRLNIWQGTLRILRDFWFAGVGQGIQAYNLIYPYYSLSNISTPHSHSLFLQIFVETGVFGLLAFIGLMGAFFKTQISFFYKTRHVPTKWLLAGFISAAAGFLVQGVFDYSFYNYRVLLIFFLFLGVSNAVVRVKLLSDFN
ncbi:MAG: O-antigen ligase family protein [Clostridiales bacterium]|nr:O-antigen ligase family protein [Clostridiales bacterium]